MRKQNRNPLPRSSKATQVNSPRKPLPPIPPEKPPPPNPPEKPPPPNPPGKPSPPISPEEINPAASPISSSSTLLSYRAVEFRPRDYFKKRHIANVYIVHGVLTLLAVAQLVTLRLYEVSFEQYVGGTMTSLLGLVLAEVVLLILAFVNMANTCPVNYILAFVTVELVLAFVNCHRWTKLTYAWMAGILALDLAMNLLLYAIGIYVPLKLLPGILALIVIGLLYLSIIFAIFTIAYLNGSPYLLRYVTMISLFYVAILVVFTVTVVHQRRFDYLALRAFVLQATILAALLVYMIDAVATVVGFGEIVVERF